MVQQRTPISFVSAEEPFRSAGGRSNVNDNRAARLAAKMLHVPIVVAFLMSDDMPLIVSQHGLPISEGDLAPLIHSWLACASEHSRPLPWVLNALRDEPFGCMHALADALDLCAGLVVPLTGSDSTLPGLFCCFDVVERNWDDDDVSSAQDFAHLVMTEIELTAKVEELVHIESELAEKHDLLRTVIDSTPDYIFVKDVEGRFVISNRAHALATGLNDPQALVGKTALETFPPELAAQFDYDDRRVMESGEASLNLERLTVDAAGSLRWVLTSKIPIRNSDNQVRGLVGISRDITQRKMAEQQLLEREAFIQRIMATIPALIYVFDLVEDRNLYSNIGVTKILGYSSEEIREMGSSLMPMLMHPDDLATRPNMLDRIETLGDHESFDLEYRMRHSDGSYRWLYSSDVVFKRDEQGCPTQMLGTALDITRLKQAEAALRESEQRTRALVNAAPVVLVEMDQEGLITFCEGKGLTSFGLEPGTALVTSAFQRWETRPQLVDGLRRALSGEVVDLTETTAEGIYQMRLSPAYDAEKRLTGVLAIGLDVTEQVRARDAAAESSARISHLRDIDIELTATLDPAHVMRTALRSAVTVSHASDGCIALLEEDALVVALGWGRYHMGELLPREGGWLNAALQQAEAFNIAYGPQQLPQNGRRGTSAQMIIPLVVRERTLGLLVLDTPSPHYFSEQTFSFVKSIALRASTALENARLYEDLNTVYERVRALEQLKTDMIRIAAHDLRNPLTAIKGYIALLTRDLGTTLTPKQQGYLTMLTESTSTMQRIVSEILSLQRIEAMQDKLIEMSVNLTELTAAVASRYQDQAEQKGIAFTFELAAPSIIVPGDEAQLREAIDNLISNALKYTPRGGVVTVHCTAEGSQAAFEVIDTGYGIASDQQARLFQPFYRVKSASTRHIEGTGLGLHLVKKIVERHRGQMQFNSSEGKGSRFGFTLPLAELRGAEAPLHGSVDGGHALA